MKTFDVILIFLTTLGLVDLVSGIVVRKMLKTEEPPFYTIVLTAVLSFLLIIGLISLLVYE